MTPVRHRYPPVLPSVNLVTAPMTFFQLIRREMKGSLHRLAIVSALAGASNCAMLAAINSGAVVGKPGLWVAGVFIISLFVYVKSEQYVLILAAAEIEALIHKLHVRLMDKIRHSELLSLEAVGRADIVAAITHVTAALKQATNFLAFTGQSVVLIIFVAIYVAYLSPAAFFLSALVVIIAGALYHAKGRRLVSGKEEASHSEARLLDRLGDFLDGFKEVRLNNLRSEDLFDDAEEMSRKAANDRIRLQGETYKRMVFAQGSIYVLLGAVVFIAPSLSDIRGTSISQATTALLFVVGACFSLVQAIPVLAEANSAADTIEQIEARLGEAGIGRLVAAAEAPKRFAAIEMRNVAFSYVDKKSERVFTVGPVDFTLRAGDLVFITGGNGSGKSTLLKLIAGLYMPDSGELALDGRPVDAGSRGSYRALVTAIFSDYHLFQKLYGIRDADPREVNRLLTVFELREKTQIVEHEFSTIDLSGGQRKRIALMTAMLENRPILLLDEWTADQDPEFRRKFYREVLPALARTGTTIVLITHDDRYLKELTLPARRLRMDEGLLSEWPNAESGK